MIGLFETTRMPKEPLNTEFRKSVILLVGSTATAKVVVLPPTPKRVIVAVACVLFGFCSRRKVSAGAPSPRRLLSAVRPSAKNQFADGAITPLFTVAALPGKRYIARTAMIG